MNYATFDESQITEEVKADIIKEKGYFLYPHQLFCNVVKNASSNENLNTDLYAIFTAFEQSAVGYPSENDIKGLFADFNISDSKLGNQVKEKNKRLAALLNGVDELDFGEFGHSQIDLFGDAYEFLISNYAANAGKSGGEFFTPQSVAKLISQIAVQGQTKINKNYDPTAGS